MNTTATPPLPSIERDEHIVLRDVAWDAYVAIGEILGDRPSLRLTYDRGRLELMTTSAGHEMDKKWLARLIEIIAEETNRTFISAGNMTFRREDLEKGLEADDCFWIAHEPQMRGKRSWAAESDPPPDLALEIEVSRSAMNRMGIYAALRVPEVWCYEGTKLRIFWLTPDGVYRRADRSLSFPEIDVAELVRFIKKSETDSALDVIRAFRAWLRQQASP